MIRNPIYVCIIIAETMLFFSISGIQYWCTHFLENHFGASKLSIFYYFMACCATGPVFGAIFSGYVCQKVGGYESIKVMHYCCIAAFVGILTGLPVPFMSDYRHSIYLIWFVLFSGVFMFPILTGVMLNNLEPHLKEHANSIANLSFNLFGYLPAPTVYGFMNSLDSGNEKSSNYGMILLLSTTVPVFFCMIIVTIAREKRIQS